MKLFGEMVEETSGYLRSFVRDQEISTHLTKAITGAPGEGKIVVADAGVVSRGRIQVDDELIWIDKVERSSNSLLVPPYGRGMDGTSPADHEVGKRVIVDPLYPRKFLKDTLNQTIRQIGAQLYGVEQLTLHATRDFKYPLPEYVRDVLTVMVSNGRRYDEPVYLRDWTFDKSAPLNLSQTGKALYLYDEWWWDVNQTVTITVSRDPMTLTSDFQPFSDTFLPKSAEDIPILGAAARLLATADSADIQTRAVEANTLDSKVSASAAQQQSKYLQALFMQRLDEERLRLLNSTSNRSHYSTNARARYYR